MYITETAIFILMGAFLGMVGQLIRVVIGLKSSKKNRHRGDLEMNLITNSWLLVS